MFLKAKKKQELVLSYVVKDNNDRRLDIARNPIYYKSLQFCIEHAFLLVFLPPFLFFFHKSQILMRAISGPVGRGCKDVT